MKLECWAKRLGPCGTRITAEHVITESLFGKRVRVEGATGPWLGVPRAEAPIKKLTANILCDVHNQELGRTADLAALRLLRALRATHDPMALPGSKTPRRPVDKRISGVNLGRWLCKTHCNLMIVNGFVPDEDYARYAFAQPTTKPLRFYFVGALGEPLRLADGRDPVVSWEQLLVDDVRGIDAFTLSLGGMKMLVSPFPVQRGGQDMIDRLSVLQKPTPLGLFRIVFDWAGEPAVRAPLAFAGEAAG